MDKRPRLHGIAVVCLLGASVAAGIGCSPQSHTWADAGSHSRLSPLEAQCERDLLILDRLIETLQESPHLPTAATLEAVELRRLAVELLLDEEYRLALELIDEAIALLEPTV